MVTSGAAEANLQRQSCTAVTSACGLPLRQLQPEHVDGRRHDGGAGGQQGKMEQKPQACAERQEQLPRRRRERMQSPAASAARPEKAQSAVRNRAAARAQPPSGRLQRGVLLAGLALTLSGALLHASTPAALRPLLAGFQSHVNKLAEDAHAVWRGLQGRAKQRKEKVANAHDATSYGGASASPPEVPALPWSWARASAEARMDVVDVLMGAQDEFGLAFQAEAQLAAKVLSIAAEARRHDAMEAALAVAAFEQIIPDRALECPLRGLSASDAMSHITGEVSLQIDRDHTARGAVSETGWLHRALLQAGAATGLSSLRARKASFESKPPEVVTARTAATLGDCFALSANTSASLAFRTRGSEGDVATALRWVVIQQLHRGGTTRPRSGPRYFEVFGDAVMGGAAAASTMGAPAEPSRYSVSLGAFEYKLAAPATQAFQLHWPPANAEATAAVPFRLRGLRLVFQGDGWGERFQCVYRVRAFAELPASCA
eukprot:TRINITY_DN16706_c0_g1_i2.p1 TRINITY_DN16706_c0_g1~~TRINITY_DN16706_c0_g1_i2.p1  ORF type:complete len:489 (-),score=91.42 TRINITY_DN16706_c0_g1_i2:363-1829(-)